MSGEFHELYGSHFLWSALQDTDGTRPITGEPVADAIRELCIALAPVERAVAWHQASDSGLDYVVTASSSHLARVKAASDKLVRAMSEYDRIVSAVLRDHLAAEAKREAA